MRYITIKRKRGNLFAAWLSYWCVFDFPIEKMPPPCAKEIDCIDCEGYCERISSHRGKLFLESCEANGTKKVLAYLHAIPVKNGKTIAVELDDQEHEMFIYLDENLISNMVKIPAGDADASYIIKTSGGIVKASIQVYHER